MKGKRRDMRSWQVKEKRREETGGRDKEQGMMDVTERYDGGDRAEE